jgi:hypothetical protein
VGSCQVVAEVILLLPLLPSYVAAAKPDLPLPNGPAAALGDRMILCPEEKMGDEGAADPIIPGSWCLWQGGTPHLADVSHVVRVVHVKPRERIPALGAGHAAQIHIELPWAWGSVNPSFMCRIAHTVNSSVDMQSILDSASDGDEIQLEDGTNTSSYGTCGVLSIEKNIAIRAPHPGKAVLDGRNSMRVIFIHNGVVLLDGLKFTRTSPMLSNAISILTYFIAASSTNETSETIPVRIVAEMSAPEKVVHTRTPNMP